MAQRDHEKNNKAVRVFERVRESLRGKFSPAHEPTRLDDPIVQPDDLLQGHHIFAFQKEANRTIHSPKTLRVAYQKIACSCLSDLGRHRDVRQLARMVNNMPENLHKDRMEKFLETYGPLTIQHDEQGKSIFAFTKNKKLRLGHALEQPWWMSQP